MPDPIKKLMFALVMVFLIFSINISNVICDFIYSQFQKLLKVTKF